MKKDILIILMKKDILIIYILEIFNIYKKMNYYHNIY